MRDRQTDRQIEVPGRGSKGNSLERRVEPTASKRFRPAAHTADQTKRSKKEEGKKEQRKEQRQRESSSITVCIFFVLATF